MLNRTSRFFLKYIISGLILLPTSLNAENEEFFKDFFFKSLLIDEPVGYTLFGDKPVSFICIEKPSSAANDFSFKGLDQKNCARVRGFKEFHHFIKSHKTPGYWFLFREESNSLILTVINEKAFLATFKELSKNSTELLEILLNNNGDLNQLFGERQDLVGIALGYGTFNSSLFQKRLQVEKGKRKLITEFPIYYYNQTDSSSLVNFSNEDNLSIILVPLPEFMVDPHSIETKGLKKSYQSQRKKVTDILRNQHEYSWIIK